MAVTLAATDIWADRRRRVSELRTRQGFARQLLDFYGALLAVREKAYLDAASAAPAPSELASYVADVVVPSVIDVSLFAGPDRFRSQLIHRLETEHPIRMIERWIAGEKPTSQDLAARKDLKAVDFMIYDRNSTAGTPNIAIVSSLSIEIIESQLNSSSGWNASVWPVDRQY